MFNNLKKKFNKQLMYLKENIKDLNGQICTSSNN
ncbi:unnamed protein product, partial [marine sediment metagenome]